MKTPISDAVITGAGWSVTGSLIEVDHLRPCIADTSPEADALRAATPDKYTCRRWLQVPYAAPPVGGLRHEAAIYAALSGAYDARNPRSVPYQNAVGEEGTDGRPQDGLGVGNFNFEALGARESEDCLSITITAPQSSAANAPTIFFIPGGGGDVNSNLSPYLQTDALSSKGAVVGLPQYRLGALGAMDDQGYNVGDLLVAWQWFRAHVAAFGGNPNKIVIGGSSFGAEAAISLSEILTGTAGFAGCWAFSSGASRRVGVQGFGGFSSATVSERVKRALWAEAPFCRDISGNFDTALEAIESQGIDWAVKNAFPPEMLNKAHSGANVWSRSRAGQDARPWEGVKGIVEPMIYQTAENEANLLGITSASDTLFLSQFQKSNLANRIGQTWQQVAAFFPGKDETQLNRFLYSFGTFNHGAYRMAKNSGGTSRLVLWNYKSDGNGGDYAGHTSDAAYFTGNADWHCGMIDDEVQAFYRDLWMQEACMNAYISFAENLDPEILHSGPSRNLFPTEPTLSFPVFASENWTVLGNTVPNAIGSPAASTQMEFFAGFPALCYLKTDP